MPIVAIAQIKVGINRRPIKQQKVLELIESIQANGLLNPITVDQNLTLIAGLHRLTACKMLGLEKIECNIINCADSAHARLAEIDENLIRSELDALERAELWLERDRILDSLRLRAKPGDNQYTYKGSKGSETISPPPKTTFELAQAVGYTERTFQQGKQIAKSILPEVKEAIKGTAIAKSTTALLKVARAGSKEREEAEKAEKAIKEAQLQQEELQHQARLAEEARTKQRELQLLTLRNVAAQKEAKLKKKSRKLSPLTREITAQDVLNTQPGDQWLLARHLVYCGDTASDEFIRCLPSHAALAIATPSTIWQHDYLVDEARIVAVLRSAGHIHQFCTQQRMPFQYELLIGGIYVALFSYSALSEPQQPIAIEGVEGIVAFLISLYSNAGNFVIAPFIGHGEALICCERMGRICFTGDLESQRVSQAIARWQQWTGKQVNRGN
ncbi:ParB N-terminal domain-containing protein [Gloeocapsopsis sp. IPPAS B-1203]|uniref:ParB N-terminal domain-containing protein n=1 Tax=Gloeocapsopsis sp. IPPAS B-1203 TaxID=2049454 RepID=UPI000C17B459|nr:ParB N-terminal domain-containing protein [Gloeocapsopsis sp. IPPAS B-1203]PIG93473.1 chromosome partitioning protein ParB [Gloeocapsopsis sp. IPPAS B-1203]